MIRLVAAQRGGILPGNVNPEEDTSDKYPLRPPY